MRHGPKTLFAFQFAAHVALVLLLIYGTWSQIGIALVVYFFTGCLGMTMTYHRLLSHQSYTPPLWFRWFGTLCATVGLTGSALSWVAIHREHHRFTDTEKDPHSPRFKGWFKTHFLSMFVPVHPRYVRDLCQERFLLFQHKHYYTLNLAYAGILYLIDPAAVIYAWLAPAAILWNAGSSIVSLSHREGYPHNDWILGLLVWGEGYHTNHHRSPAQPVFGRLDLGGWLIRRLDRAV